MLGFHAYTQQTDLEVDSEELRDARWFTSDALAGFGEWGDEGASCKLPPHDSIARDLIETWRREVTGEQGR